MPFDLPSCDLQPVYPLRVDLQQFERKSKVIPDPGIDKHRANIHNREFHARWSPSRLVGPQGAANVSLNPGIFDHVRDQAGFAIRPIVISALHCVTRILLNPTRPGKSPCQPRDFTFPERSTHRSPPVHFAFDMTRRGWSVTVRRSPRRRFTQLPLLPLSHEIDAHLTERTSGDTLPITAKRASEMWSDQTCPGTSC